MRLLGFQITRAREERAYTVQDLARELGGLILNGEPDPFKVTQEGFRENPTVGAAITKVQTAANQVPWIAQLEEQDGERKDADPDHPAARLLAHPCEFYGWDRIVDAAIGNLELFGEAYFYLNGPGDPTKTPEQGGREPTEVLWLPKAWVQRDPTQSYANLQVIRLMTRDGTVELPTHRVVYINLWNPSGPFAGQSRLRHAAGSIDAANLAAKWNRNLLKNSGRPPGAFTNETVLDDNTFARLKAEIRETYLGSENAGRPPLLDGGLKFQSTGMTAGEMEWLAGSRESKREIATCLGVDPTFLGDSEVRTYANYSEARRALYEDTVIPFLGLIKSAFEAKLSQWWPELRLFLDTDQVPVLMETRQAAWSSMAGLVERGILTRNEARAAMGYEDVPGGDQILVPLSSVPLGDQGVMGGAEQDPVGDPALTKALVAR